MNCVIFKCRERAPSLKDRLMKYTKEDIVKMLEESNKAVELGILRIHTFQTHVEQSIRETTENNTVGWNAFHANFMSSLAEWIKKSPRPEGQRLSPKQMAKARPIIKKYARQLMEFANGKQ